MSDLAHTSATAASGLKYTQLSTDPDESHGMVLAAIPDGAIVLEVGAATGYMTEALRARGCRVLAIEPDIAAVQEASARGVVVQHGYLSDVVDTGDKFDWVLLVDVLEHVQTPLALLADVHRVLAPGGRLVLSVPNVAHWSVRWQLLRGRFDYTPTGLLDDTHLRFYTRESLAATLAQAGYEVIHARWSLGQGSYDGRRSFLSRSTALRWYRRRVLKRLVRRWPGMFGYQHLWVARARHGD